MVGMKQLPKEAPFPQIVIVFYYNLSVSRNTESNRKVRQGNIFRTMMDSYDQTISLTNTALNSNGFAMDANNKKLDTTAKKYEELKATMTTQWLKAINSDIFKPWVEGATSLVKTFGNLHTVILDAITVFALFKGKAITDSISSLVSYQMALGATTASEALLAGATSTLSATFNALKAAIATNPIGAIAVAFTTLVGVFDIVNNKMDEQKQKVQELKQKHEEQLATVQQEYEQTMKSVNDANKLLDEQNKIISSGSDKTNADEKQRLQDIETQLAKIVPDATTSYDKQNQALAENLDLTKQLIKAKKEEADNKALEIVSSIDPKEEMDKLKTVKNAFDEVDKIMKKPHKEGKISEDDSINQFRIDFVNNNKDLLTQEQIKSIQQAKTMIDLSKALASVHADLSKQMGKSETNINRYNAAAEWYNKLGQKQFEVVKDESLGITGNTSIIDDNTKSKNDNVKATEEQVKSIDDLQSALDGNLTKANNYAKMLNEIKDKGVISESSQKEILTKKDYQDLLPFLTDMNSLSSELSKRIDDVQSKSVALFAAMGTQRESQSIQDLIKQYQDLSSNEHLEEDQKKTLASIVEQLKGKVDGFVETKGKDDNATKSNITLTNDRIKSLDNEQKYLQLVAQVGQEKAKDQMASEIMKTDTTYTEVKARIKAYQDEANAMSYGGDGRMTPQQQQAMMAIMEIDDTIKASEADLAKARQQAGDIINTLTTDTSNNTEKTKENTKAQKELNEQVKQAQLLTKEYDNALKALDATLYGLQSSMESMDQSSESYRNALKQEIELLKQKTDVTKNYISVNEQQANSLLSNSGQNASSALGSQIVAGAEKYLGTPYVSGGKAPGGFDCSGLVQFVYDQVGVSLNRTSQTQFKQGTEISKADLQPGDLVFFKGQGGSSSAPGHVAIYAGGGEIVESPHTGASVRMANLNDRSDYVGARRVLSSNSNANTNANVNVNVTVPKGGFSSADSFLNAIMPYAQAMKQKYDITPSLLLAQAMAESANGSSYLAKTDNNYFGMTWTGKNGQKGSARPEGGNYVHYNNMAESVEAYAKLLRNYGANGQDFNSGLENVANHGYATDPSYRSLVKSKYNQYGLGKYDSGDYPSASLNYDTLIGEAETLQGKTQDLQKSLIDYAKQIQQDYAKIYQSQMKAYDEQNAHVDRNKEMAQTMYNLYKDNDSLDGLQKASAYKEQIWKEINWHFSVLNEKEKYINQELVNTAYDEKTRTEMVKSLEEIRIEKQKTVVELHNEFQSWQQEMYNSSIRVNKDNIESLQSKLNILDKSSNQNYDEKIALNNRLIEQNKQIQKQTLDRIAALQKLINVEKDSGSMSVWINQQKELNKELDNTNEKIIEEQQNNIKLAEDKAMKLIEKQIYGGQTQKEFENTKKAQINALDDQLEAMQKQNEALQEQETRQKNLLDLAEAQIKLQEAQNEKNVQQLTKDKNGNWQFQYVSNQQTVNDLEKAMRDKIKSNNDWEKQTSQKHQEEAIQDQKKQLQAEIDIRNEAYNTIKSNLEDALNNQENAFANGTTSINEIVGKSLDDLRTIHNGKYGNIISTTSDALSTIDGTLASLNKQIASSQSVIGSIGKNTVQGITPQGNQKTVWVTDTRADSPDYKTAQQYYASLGYDVKEITDKNSKDVTNGDVLLGQAGTDFNNLVGDGVRKVTGRDRDETAKKAQKDAMDLLEQAGKDSLEIEEKYSQSVTQTKQSAANRNTIIVKSATTGETMTIQKGANTNMNIIKQSWDGINSITYDQMGNMVVTVSGKVDEASAKLRELIALQAEAGLGGGGGSSGNAKPTDINIGGGGESMYIANGITYHYDANKTNIEEYLKTHKFATGGETQRTGLHWLDGNSDEPERVLSSEQTEGFNNLVFKQLPELKNIIPNLSNLISNIQLPKISLPDFSGLFNRDSQQQSVQQQISINAHFPNATNQEEIEKAFNSLSLGAIQYAHPSY